MTNTLLLGGAGGLSKARRRARKKLRGSGVRMTRLMWVAVKAAWVEMREAAEAVRRDVAKLTPEMKDEIAVCLGMPPHRHWSMATDEAFRKLDLHLGGTDPDAADLSVWLYVDTERLLPLVVKLLQRAAELAESPHTRRALLRRLASVSPVDALGAAL